MLQTTMNGVSKGGILGGLGDLTLTDAQVMQMEVGGLLTATLLGVLAGVHGYRRNRKSVGWGITWGLLGATFPLITLPVALVQGYAK